MVLLLIVVALIDEPSAHSYGCSSSTHLSPSRHLHPRVLRTSMRFTRWGVEHGVLVLCTVATAGALGNMYYKKKNDIPYKVKLVKDPDGFNDVMFLRGISSVSIQRETFSQ